MRRILFFLCIALVIAGPAMAASPVFNISVPGERNAGQEFTWAIENVSGTRDIIYHYTVYASRIIGLNYSYYSNSWGRWDIQPAHPGFQFLAVWIRGWAERATGWGYGPDRYRVWVWGTRTIDPESVHLNDLPVKYRSERYSPVVIAELENRTMPDGKVLTTEWYGWKDGQELTRVEPGESNAWDGVILYQIPIDAGLDDIRVAGWYGDFYGTAIWYLTEHQIVQDSFETWKQKQEQALIRERLAGLRMSDRPRARVRA